MCGIARMGLRIALFRFRSTAGSGSTRKCTRSVMTRLPLEPVAAPGLRQRDRSSPALRGVAQGGHAELVAPGFEAGARDAAVAEVVEGFGERNVFDQRRELAVEKRVGAFGG